MAILLEEEGLYDRARLYATDISDAVLERARRGDHLGVVDWLPTTLGRFVEHAPLGCYFVLGNHDAYDDPDRIRERYQKLLDAAIKKYGA